MSNKKPTHGQISLIPKAPVPPMPEGYYSAGPNPNLQKFVEEHAKPYDPETDHYDVPPFDQPITTTKATAIYNMHTYWSKKPHDAIQQYIRHYTQPGDLVLDPFCGSGGTALAALMEGRCAIAIDLSPAATFITKNYCTPVDVDELQRAFEELKAKVKPEMDWLYETRCDRCDGRATTAYTVYSYVFQCPRCLEKITLFDCPEAQSQTAQGKPKTIRICPSCQKRGVSEEIKTSGVRMDPIPVLVSYLCEEGCKPKRGERRHNDPNPKKREYFEKYDMVKIREIESKPIPYWYPPHRMMNVESDTEQWGDKWRAGTSNFRTVAELFTKRNLWALGLLLAKIKEFREPYSHALMFTVSSFLLNLTKLYKHRESGGGQPTGNYYVPQIHRENEAWSAFDRKFADIVAGLQELPEVLNGNTNVIVSTQSALSLPQIPDESMDHIFTDPPYAGKYQYGELNFVWEAWLDLNTNWHSGEVIVNERRRVTDDDWAAMMLVAMKECFRILKPGRWLALCYHDTSEGTWSLIQDLMAQTGFIVDHAEETLYIDTGQKTYNQTQAEKVTQRDLVINFRKPRPGEITENL
ncbi:MAG: DNA methyltransferase, partial [Chloroflexota bacterium]